MVVWCCVYCLDAAAIRVDVASGIYLLKANDTVREVRDSVDPDCGKVYVQTNARILIYILLYLQM